MDDFLLKHSHIIFFSLKMSMYFFTCEKKKAFQRQTLTVLVNTDLKQNVVNETDLSCTTS